MFASVLIANRGEIARRIARTARSLDMKVISVHSDADAEAPHVAESDTAIEIGTGPATDSYLRTDRIVDAALASGAEAVHPGYGFLAESATLARAVLEEGLAWVGPAPETLEALGDKVAAQKLMDEAGVPVSGGGEVVEVEDAVSTAHAIGYPVMVKPAAGGGGIGMRWATNDDELRAAFTATQLQAERFFGDGRILLERFLRDARHVEVQILGAADGEVMALGERDCSVQRRFQKVVEESPSPVMTDGLRRRMLEAAVSGARSVGYRNAGTFEFLVSGEEFVFLEVNARLQVEHPVTELVTNLDLVAEQFRIASGQDTSFDPTSLQHEGHAVELRVYAEDPGTFFPSPGTIEAWDEPRGPGIRVDAAYTAAGQEVSRYYDPLLAKLCAHGKDRAEALDRALRAIRDFKIRGIKTNCSFLEEVLTSEEFRSGHYDTNLVSKLRP